MDVSGSGGGFTASAGSNTAISGKVASTLSFAKTQIHTYALGTRLPPLSGKTIKEQIDIWMERKEKGQVVLSPVNNMNLLELGGALADAIKDQGLENRF